MGQKVNPNLLRLKNSKEWFLKNISKTSEECSIFTFQSVLIKNFLKNILTYYGIFICNCKIHRTNTFVYIYFSYFLNNKNRKKISSCSFNSKCFMNFILNILNTFTGNKLIFRLICQDTNKYILNLAELHKLKRYKLRYIFKKLFEFPFKKYEKRFKIIFSSLLNVCFHMLLQKNSVLLLSEYLANIYSKKIFKKKHMQLFYFLKEIIKTFLNYKLTKIQGIKVSISGRLNGKLRTQRAWFLHNCLPLSSHDAIVRYSESTAFTIYGTFGIKVWLFEKKICKKTI